MPEHNARLITPSPAVLRAQLGHDAPLAGGFLALRLDNVPARAVEPLTTLAVALGGLVAPTGAGAAGGVLLLLPAAALDGLLERMEAARPPLPALAAELAALAENLARRPAPLVCGPYTLPTGARTLIMGILNMTPDSFSGDGLGLDVDAALAQARRMHAEGADLLDIGGMSTRPGAAPVSGEQEIARVVPVITRLAAEVPLPLSVDTFRAATAAAALAAGAHIVNDITGFREDPDLLDVAARHGAAVIAMHIQGRPATMQENPIYQDLLGEVIAYLRESVRIAEAAGIPRERVWIDPGIGFGKTFEHNLELLRRLGELRCLGQPILVGTSRKAFVGRLVGGKQGAERAVGTGATLALSIAQGADMVRVHDVAVTNDVVRVADAVVRFPFA